MQGNSEGFMALLKPVYSNAVQYCLALTKDEASAKDLLQELLLKGFQHFNCLKDHEKFKSWFFTIIEKIIK